MKKPYLVMYNMVPHIMDLEDVDVPYDPANVVVLPDHSALSIHGITGAQQSLVRAVEFLLESGEDYTGP